MLRFKDIMVSAIWYERAVLRRHKQTWKAVFLLWERSSCRANHRIDGAVCKFLDKVVMCKIVNSSK